jgi:FMN phosphatase YigB (HAD superfamily)
MTSALQEARVFVAADFLFTKESEQFSNRRWFKDILNRPITLATGRAPESFATSLTDKTKLSRKRFFALSDIVVNEGATQFWFDDKRITQASIDYLNEFLPRGSVVVGYELAEQSRAVLDRAGVHYVDIWLHPIRFYDDVLFGFSSGTRSVYDALKPFHVSDDNFWLYADRLKVQLYKGWRRDELELPNNSALLVGQTLEDKAICRGGKMLTLLDFKAQVEKMSAEHERVYFSRHPFVKTGDEAVLKWLQSLPNVELTAVPSYHLIANQAIKKVAAISSSVVHEARFFGKKTEFFYKPIFTFGQRFGKDYVTVYHDFFSPHFWSAVLAPLVATKECQRVVFAEGKDKVRDMLAFYWAWPTVDKTEGMRVKLNAVASKVHEMGKAPAAGTSANAGDSAARSMDAPLPVCEPGRTSSEFLADARKRFKQADVVSFDVFDTVVERPYDSYETLFTLLAPEVERLTGIPANKFAELRKRSRSLAEGKRTSEEVSLPVRYAAMLESAGVSTEHATTLAAFEFEMDQRVLRARPVGKQLFDLALAMGKRVVFVSDIYYSTEQVAAILDSCGYRGYESVFTSCDEGLLKHTGKLYPHVLSKLGVAAERCVHIGDNLHADKDMAQAQGLQAMHLPQASHTFQQRSHQSRMVKYAHADTQSVIRGLLAKRYHDLPDSGLSHTWCEGAATRFGYAVAGPMFAGFAHWVARKARDMGIERLYFLARDGDIVKQVYDQMAPHIDGAPESRYLLASRRSVNVAAIRALPEALALLKVNFTPCSIGNLLKARYGLEGAQVPPAALAAGEYESLDSVADFKAHQARLARVVTELWPVIDANCSQERHALMQYYREQGVLEDGKFAIVDIGHNGTMQMSLANLTGQKMPGLYFVTYSAIRDLAAHGLTGYGYVAEALDGKASKHAYAQYLLMFEMLFLNDQGSFVKMLRRDSGELAPVHLPLTGEESRVAFIRQVHGAAVEFAHDLAMAMPSLSDLRISGDEAIASYVGMLRSPSVPDAMMLEGVAFENVYSGRDARYILAPEGSAHDSVWKEGLVLLSRHRENAQPAKHPLLSWLIKTWCSELKWLKFERSPEKFFGESRVGAVRLVGRLYGYSAG